MRVNKTEYDHLIAKVVEADQLAFKKLFDLFSANIYATVQRITGDECLAEEILQDVFVKVWVNRNSLLQLDNFEAWLYTVARNMTYNAIKSSQKQKQKFVQHARESFTLFPPEADHLMLDKEFQGILSQAIERLPEKQKIAYKMVKKENLTREQVAERLGVATETVKSNLDHAMRNIRAYCVARLKDVPILFFLHLISKYF